MWVLKPSSLLRHFNLFQIFFRLVLRHMEFSCDSEMCSAMWACVAFCFQRNSAFAVASVGLVSVPSTMSHRLLTVRYCSIRKLHVSQDQYTHQARTIMCHLKTSCPTRTDLEDYWGSGIQAIHKEDVSSFLSIFTYCHNCLMYIARIL